MSEFHYYIVELDLPEVVGACTISGEPGFSTPLTCPDQESPTTVIKTHKFTDTGLILAESDIHKCVNKVSETTPRLKTGNGVASRATANISFIDFIGDPNLLSPALVDNPGIESNGTFFGKLKSRNILANKAVRVKYYKRVDNVDTLIRVNNYIATDIKRGSKSSWSLTCNDILYKADDDNAQFPKVVTGRLRSDITDGETTVVIDGNIADWTPYADFTAVIGKDLLMITNATGDSGTVTLTVVRASSITLGSRTITNEPAAHNSGDEVFRGRKFVSAKLYTVLTKVFEDAEILPSEYDGAGIEDELSNWLPSIDNSIDCIFYEPKEATRQLDSICATFMLDIWTDTQAGKIKLKATTPWNSTSAILTENENIIDGSLSIDEPKKLHYSRAFLQYDKRNLTDNDDDVNFTRSSLAINTDLESELFYDEEKLKKLGKSIVLSNRANNIEVADLTTVRYAQRFSNRPQEISLDIQEQDLTFSLGDVIEIVTSENQDAYGNARQGVRSQVVQIIPSYNVGRKYKINTVTYNPYVGGIEGSDLTINTTTDINLFTEAGGPVSADTYTFLFNGQNFGQNLASQAIQAGSFPMGSILNVVLLNGAVQVGKGGTGGAGGFKVEGDTAVPPSIGTAGGITLKGQAGVIINVYLNGSTGDLGNGSYTADGYLYASGGGGKGGDSIDGAFTSRGGGGGGGAGFIAGEGGYAIGGSESGKGQAGTLTTGGIGGIGSNAYDGDAGGDLGENGENGSLAGSGVDLNGGIINIMTSGETTRFISGSGDTPTTLT